MAGNAFGANSAVQPEPVLHLGWIKRDFYYNREARADHPELIFIGDSIVQKFGEQGKAVWDHYYSGRDAMNLGINGDQTENVLWRLEHGNIRDIDPKLAIVMIGQNNSGHNSAGEISAGIAAVVQTLREKLPDTKVLVLAITPRGARATPERAVLAEASTEAARMADNRMVFFLDTNSVFLRRDGSIPQDLMGDYEHPTELGYLRWAEALEPTVSELLGDRPVPPMVLSGVGVAGL